MKYVSEELLNDINDFLLEKYEPPVQQQILFQNAYGFDEDMSLNDILKTEEETFQEKLFSLIREKKLDEVEIYKKSNLSRQHFSKIRSEKNYKPTKNTVFLLSLAMHLSIDEVSDLLGRAGLSFSCSNKTDLIFQYFLYHKIYNIFELNEVLEIYKLEII